MSQVEDLAVREQEPTLSGREMTMVLGLNKTAKPLSPTATDKE
jgi:hypothetical protein